MLADYPDQQFAEFEPLYTADAALDLAEPCQEAAAEGRRVAAPFRIGVTASGTPKPCAQRFSRYFALLVPDRERPDAETTPVGAAVSMDRERAVVCLVSSARPSARSVAAASSSTGRGRSWGGARPPHFIRTYPIPIPGSTPLSL